MVVTKWNASKVKKSENNVTYYYTLELNKDYKNNPDQSFTQQAQLSSSLSRK